MNKLWIAGLAGLLIPGFAPACRAQGVFAPPIGSYNPPATSPFYRPAVSPYLNLGLSGNPGISYYGIVRPQLNTYAALNQLQQQQTAQAGLSAGDPNNPYAGTGHATRFYNTSHYFNNRGGAGALATQPSGTTAPAAQLVGRLPPAYQPPSTTAPSTTPRVTAPR